MRRVRVRVRVFLAAIAVVSFSASAQVAPWPSQDVVWYTGEKPGALDLLVVAPPPGLGDAQALAARTDADVTAWPLTVFQTESKLKPPRTDVLVVANAGVAPPEPLQDLIRMNLEQGRGVMLVQYKGDAPVNPGMLEGLTEAAGAELLLQGTVAVGAGEPAPEITLYEGKRTRLAILRFATSAPLSHCLVARPPERAPLHWGAYDSAMALPVRLVLWAARMDPPVRIVDVSFPKRAELDPADIPPGMEREQVELLGNLTGNPQLEEFFVRFSGPLDRYYELTARIRYPETGLSSSYTLTLDKGIESYSMQIPIGFHDYVADFLLTDGGETWDWYSLTGHKLGWPYFDSVTFAKTRLSANDTLTVTAEIPPHPVTPVRGRLWLRAQDSYGRTVALENRTFEASAGRTVVHADVKGLFAPGLLVDAYAVAGERTVLSALDVPRSAAVTRAMAVDVPLVAPFVFSTRARISNEWGMRRHYRALRDAGVQAVTVSGAENASEDRLHEAGLFPPIAIAGRDLAPVNVAAGTAEEASFAVWRALLAQSEGIDVRGVELPGMDATFEDEATAWDGVVETMRTIHSGWDLLIGEAQLTARGVVRADADDLWPTGFTPKQADFRGEWFEYRFGEASVVALLADPDSKATKLRADGDTSSTRYLPLQLETYPAGKPASVEVAPGRAAIVGWAPYEISRVLVNTGAVSKAGSMLSIKVEVKTRDRLPDRHVFHVTVQPTGGEPIAHYSRAVSGAGGLAVVEIPLALNEAPGIHTVRATDVMTGISGEMEFSVLPN